MNILILGDGKAGHVSQAKAVAMALGKSRTVSTSIIECRLRAGFFQRPLRWLLNVTRGRLPRLLFRWMHAGGGWPASPPDLVVSAGGSTCAANAWLGAKLRVPNIFCGSIRSLRPELFAGIVTAFDPPQPHARYIRCTTPVPVEPAELAEKGNAWRERSGLTGPCWSLLAGGDGAGYRYTTEDWRQLAAALSLLAKQHGIRWLVSTSRRSGAAGERTIFENLAPGIVTASTKAVQGGGDIAYHEILGAAERHFVTEDSHMMITEAIASGRPVHTLQPAEFTADEGNLHFLRLYETSGWITRQSIAELAAAGMQGLPPAPQVPPAILDDLAARLEEWIGRLPNAQRL